MKSKVTALAAIVALSVSSASFAHHHKHHSYKQAMYKGEAPVCQRTTLHDGLYLGVAGGYDSLAARQDSIYTSLAGGGSFIINNPMRVNGFLGGVFGGYGYTFGNIFYLGAELLGNYSSATGTASFSQPGALTSTTSVTVRGSYGISALPGIKPTDTSLIYVRLGYNRANLVVNENLAIPTDLSGNLVAAAANKSVWEGGFNYGMGVEFALVDRLSMRTEFTHIDYSHFRNNALSNTTGSPLSKFSVADNQFMVGLAYHFDGTGSV